MSNNGIDYKRKYEELKARYIQSLDLAFRSGYEQGFNESKNQQNSQQLEPLPSTPENMDRPMNPESDSDELDQAIAKLENLVNKSEPSADDLKKSIDLIKNEHMHKKMLKKTKSLNALDKVSNSYKVNLPENSKAAVAMQQKVVEDILRKWETEESKISKDITQFLGTEALTKKNRRQ